MLAAAPVVVVVVGPVVVAAVEAGRFVAADQAVAGRTSDVARAVKLVAVVTEFAEAVVAVVVVSWSVHEDPLLVVACKSEAAPPAVARSLTTPLPSSPLTSQ